MLHPCPQLEPPRLPCTSIRCASCPSQPLYARHTPMGVSPSLLRGAAIRSLGNRVRARVQAYSRSCAGASCHPVRFDSYLRSNSLGLSRAPRATLSEPTVRRSGARVRSPRAVLCHARGTHGHNGTAYLRSRRLDPERRVPSSISVSCAATPRAPKIPTAGDVPQSHQPPTKGRSPHKTSTAPVVEIEPSQSNLAGASC